MWVEQKKKIDAFKAQVLFQEREIWWCASGVNIGHEQDGSGEKFLRPVLIIRKFNASTAWVLPLTTSLKEKPYRLFVMFEGNINTILLSQLKLVDEKRLVGKMAKLSTFQFIEIKKALVQLLGFGELLV